MPFTVEEIFAMAECMFRTHLGIPVVDDPYQQDVIDAYFYAQNGVRYG